MSDKLTVAIAEVNKRFGKGSIMELSQSTASDPVSVISTGNAKIDLITGIGGVPKGRIVEIYGPECLDADTFIAYDVQVQGRRSNNKGGSIKRLYERFHKLPTEGDGRGKYQRIVTENAEFYASSINEDGRIFKNRICNVVSSGMKECYRVKTSQGYEIIASANHAFWTGQDYVLLSNLAVGDTVYIHNNTAFTVCDQKDSNKNRAFLYVKYHPIAGIKVIRDKGNTYEYHRLKKARAVVEADMNGLSLESFVDRLNSGNIEGLLFLSRDEQVHHIDENETNDQLDNLEVLPAEDHSRRHAVERHNNLRFIAVPDKIVEQEYLGPRETYDLQMENPHNNFIANGFVVHNSGGKTTLTLQIIAQAQKAGGKAVFIDAEHALDPVYATALGVDIDRLLVSQPDCGEDALEIAQSMIQSGEVAIVVIDSVAALVPRSELEGDMGDAQMGLQARLMSQAMRKLTVMVARTQTCLVFINQVRDKLGVMFGSPETTAGGRALKFYSSIRIDVRRIAQKKKGDTIIGNEVKVKIAKNKCAAPFKEEKLILEFGKGFINS